MSFNLYQENILDHSENPYNRGTLENPTLAYRDLNPLCGDEVCVQARLDERECLAESMLMEVVEHKSLEAIKQMGRQEMLELLGIPLTTMRIKCAMLPLRTLEKAIHAYETQHPALTSKSESFKSC